MDYRQIVLDWDAHLRENNSTGEDAFWREAYSEWLAFMTDYVLTGESK